MPDDITTPAVTWTLEKRNRRLWVLRNGAPVYTPPFFLRVNSRTALQALVNQLAAGYPYIRAVMAFERDAPRDMEYRVR